MSGEALVVAQEEFDEPRGVALAPYQDPVAPFIESLDARWRVAKMIAGSGMVKDSRPEAVLSKMLAGYELGVPPMMSVRSIHFFDGQLVFSSSLMRALAQRHGVGFEVVVWDETECSLEVTRPGRPVFKVSFTMEEAKTAGLLHKDNWKKYPKDMLFARASARGCRAVAPDIFMGVYIDDEVPEASLKKAIVSGGSDELKEAVEAANADA